jgi:hypothetical protein
VTAAFIVMGSERGYAQDDAPAAGRAATIAGCPRASQELYPCAKAKAAAFSPPRFPNGTPDFQGAWSPQTAGSQNIEDYLVEDAYFFAKQRTLIVDPPDGKIPYQPWGVAQRAKHFKEYIDPFALCYPMGQPRQMYGARGYHILQTAKSFAVVSEWAHVFRMIPTDGSPHIGKGIKLFMGDSRGHWEGKTFVIDTTNLNDMTWFDIVGDFHSENLHVTEKLTMIDIDTLLYEATMEDPTIFTRPWTMAFAIKRFEKGHEVLEEACYEGDRSVPNLMQTGYKPYIGLSRAR